MYNKKQKTKNKNMKKIVIKIIVIYIVFNSIIGIIKPIDKVKAERLPYNIVCYSGEVKHFFTHELIYSPQKAFSPKNSLRYAFDRDHLQTNEFVNFLDEMRLNDYVLIDINMLYTIKEGKVKKNTIYLPFNKKPFTLSLDDMSYDTSNRGIINKIILDENNELKDWTDCEEEKVTTRRESITILEEYLKKYPEFSINNSKMCICVNGYNGVLGYRIQGTNKDREEEIKSLTKVVEKLKNLGYTFASHSYSHSFINSISPEFLAKDMYKWQTEIEAVIGKTNIYSFPGGIHSAKSYKDAMIRDKFKILLCVGLDLKKPIENTENYVYIYRTPLDGNSLRTYPNMYRDIFEPSKIYDNTTRFKKYYDF